MRREPYEQWAEATDKRAAEEELAASEVSILASTPDDPRAQREEEVWDALGDLASNESEDDEDAMRRIVDGSLAASEAAETGSTELATNDAAAEVDAPATGQSISEVDPPPPSGSKHKLLRNALVLTLGAAAAGAIFIAVPDSAPTPDAGPAVAARAELVFATGEVTIDGRPAQAGDGLVDAGASIEVGRGLACLAVDPGGDLCLGPDTAMQIERLDSRARDLVLTRGAAIASLDAQPQGSRFRIEHPHGHSTAIGTVFATQVAGDVHSTVTTTVLEGKVVVATGEVQRDVLAHQQARATVQGTQVETVDRSEEARWRAMLGPLELWKADDAGALRVHADVVGAQVFVDGQELGLAPLSTLLASGPHEVRISHPQRAEFRTTIEVPVGASREVRGELEELAPPVELDPPSQVTDDDDDAESSSANGAAEVQKDAKVPSAAEQLGQARALMSEGRWRPAVRTYKRLQATHPGSAEAHAALVTMGDLQLDHLKRPKSALDTYAKYLRKGGPMEEEVRAGRVRALRALGNTKRERQALEDFVRRYPGGLETAQMRRRLETLVGDEAK